MKKMMIIAAMVVASLTASAQNEVGQLTLQPKVGMNITNISGAKIITGTNKSEDANFMVDFTVGVEAEYGIAEKFSMAAGVLYSRQGCDYGEFKSTIGGQSAGWDKNQDKLGYLNIPIVANYYIAKGFAIKAGVQPGFLLSAKRKVDGFGGYPSSDEDFKDACKSFDLSIPLGLSYESNNLVIDGRYNLGVTKINKEGDDSMKNSVIQFTIGYKFAL